MPHVAPWYRREDYARVREIQICDRLGSSRTMLHEERRELVYRAFHPVAGPVGASRVDRVVVRRPWLETVDAHSENRVRVGHVQPDADLAV
jgi:hypothetical protein